MVRWGLLVWLGAMLGCAHAAGSAAECPPVQHPRCLTTEDCKTDSRGCLTCQCGTGGYVPSESPVTPGAPPLR